MFLFAIRGLTPFLRFRISSKRLGPLVIVALNCVNDLVR